MSVLRGIAEDTLPAFAASKEFDVLVMGALTRRRGLAALVGTLTSKLVDALDCDFVLVKPETYACPLAEPVAAMA
jgi:universal stress protein E